MCLRSTTKTSVSFGPSRAGSLAGRNLVGRDHELAAAATFIAGDAVVPARDDLTLTEREAERLAAVPGRVELLAVGPRDSDVLA